MNPIRLSAVSVALVMSAVVMPALATFKCVDERGVTHYGDTMPPQCAKRDVSEITREGNVTRRYDAPLTTEQQRVREAELTKRAAENKLIATQRQKDVALTATFGSEREFDTARTNDIAQLDARKATLDTRLADVDKLIQKYTNELEFYKAGKGKNAVAKEPPAELTKNLARVRADREALSNESARADKEKEAISVKYEGEKSRWKQLKAGMAPGTIVDAKGNVVLAPPPPKRPPPTVVQ
jgi:chromosome segregation ATPase